MGRITRTGRDWTQPDCRSDWQRERADGEFVETEMSPIGRLACWTVILLSSFGIWFAIIVQVVS